MASEIMAPEWASIPARSLKSESTTLTIMLSVDIRIAA